MILVTGASINLGRHVARELVRAGAPVRTLVRPGSDTAPLEEVGCDVVAADLASPDTLNGAFDGISHAFLYTGESADIVRLQTHFVDAAARAGVRRLVKVSSHTATEPPVSFGRWHREIEIAIEDTDLAWTFLRPYITMQNFARFAPRFTTHGTLIAPVKDAGIAMVDECDVAAVAAAVLLGEGHDGVTYDISGPEALTMERVAKCIAIVRGRPVKHVSPPPFVMPFLLRLITDLPAWQRRQVVELFQSLRSGTQATVTDIVAKLVGRIPTTLDDFVRENLPLFTEHDAVAGAS